MGLLNNLPVIMAASASFFAGLYGYLNNMPNIPIYGNMCLFLVVFYIIGLMIRNTVKNILEDMRVKEELLKAEELQLAKAAEAALGVEAAGVLEMPEDAVTVAGATAAAGPDMTEGGERAADTGMDGGGSETYGGGPEIRGDGPEIYMAGENGAASYNSRNGSAVPNDDNGDGAYGSPASMAGGAGRDE